MLSQTITMRLREIGRDDFEYKENTRSVVNELLVVRVCKIVTLCAEIQ